MQNLLDFFTQASIRNLSKQIAQIFQDLPHLPKNVKKILADLLPYSVFIFAIVFLSTMAFTLLGSQQAVFRWGIFDPFHLLNWGLDILIALLFLAAFESLRQKKAIGWYAVFSAAWLSAIKHFFQAIWGISGWLPTVLSLFLSLYLLYELQTEFSLGKTVSSTKKTGKPPLKQKAKKK